MDDEIKTDIVTVRSKKEDKDRWDFNIAVEGSEESVEYSVVLKKSYWNKLTRGQVEPDELVLSSFNFLLKRESEKAILRKFNLWEINEYFPEYEKEIQKLLGVKIWSVPYRDFEKLDLRIAKIKEAERVEGSEKLLVLQVDVGGEEKQIIAGIGKFYEPKSLIGREIVIIANLEPRVVMGLESQGMLLAANAQGNRPVLLKPEEEVPSGTRIR